MSEAPWRVVVRSSTRRDIARLPEAMAWAVLAFITDRLPTNPHRLGGELTGPFVGRRSARLGTYRIIYRIDAEARTVYVLAVKARGDVYGIR